MISLTHTPTPHTTVTKLQWYSEHLPKMTQKSLVEIATNPKRGVMDPNERIVAIMIILKKGIESQDVVKPLLDLLKDENDYPLTQGTTHEKENNALLRGDTAIALAKYGVKTQEFIGILITILKSIVTDPVFITKNTPTNDFMNFACALYIADKDSIITEPVMKAYTSIEMLDEYIRTS